MTGSEEALLLRMVEQLRDDFAEEREASRQNRAGVHRRLDEVNDRLARMDTTAALSGQVDAQVRSELDALNAKVTAQQPTIDEWQRMRAIGLGIVGLIATGGLSIGAMLAWGGDTLSNLIRHWLRIN